MQGQSGVLVLDAGQFKLFGLKFAGTTAWKAMHRPRVCHAHRARSPQT